MYTYISFCFGVYAHTHIYIYVCIYNICANMYAYIYIYMYMKYALTNPFEDSDRSRVARHMAEPSQASDKSAIRQTQDLPR